MIEEYMHGLQQHRFRTPFVGNNRIEKVIRFTFVTYLGGVTNICGKAFSLGGSCLEMEHFQIPLSQHDLIDRHTVKKRIKQFFQNDLIVMRKPAFAKQVGIWADAF